MLVQPSEVTPLLGLNREMSTGEQLAIRSILEDIEAEVAGIIGSVGISTHTETVTVQDPYPQYGSVPFNLSFFPVKSIISVTINATALAAANYSFGTTGVKVYGGFTRNLLNPVYTVTATVVYTAGYDEKVLARIRPVVKRRAVRLVNKVSDEAIGTDRVTLEGYNSSWLAEGFTEQEEAIIRRAAGTHWAVSSPDTTEQEMWFPQTWGESIW